MIESGKGVYLFDTAGKKYLDGVSGCVVANIGYGVTSVADALRDIAAKIGFVHGSTFTNMPKEKLAQKLASLAPEGIDYVYFVSGGTEANETAIQMALQYHKQRGNKEKWKIIGRTLSYHGSSLGTMSISSNIERRRMFSPLLLPFPLVPAPHCYRCYYELTYPDCSLLCAKTLERVVLSEGPENIAAFIAEPVIGTSAAASVPPEGYFRLVREICDKYDIVFIADEVMCGYGRTGYFSALEHWGIKPDIITLGKGLSGGYSPLGAVLADQKIHQVFKDNWGKFIHGYTFQGNPISCAAGLAVFDIIERENLFGQVVEKGNYLMNSLKELSKQHRIIGDVRGKGLFFGLELVKDQATRESYDKSIQLAEQIKKICMDEGLIIYTGVGASADVKSRDCLLIAPPFIISKDEMDILVQLLDNALKKAENKLLNN